MDVVYGAPSGGGWHPVTHMVRLLAELLSARLVVVPINRMANAGRRLAAPAPRRRGRGTCLVVAASPRHLGTLLRGDYWLRGYGHVAGWVIDSFWVDRIPRVAREHFDQLFVADKEVIDVWKAATGLPVTWLPWGADVLRLGSGDPDRPIDLQRVGRQPPGWEDDDETGRLCAEAGLRFEGRFPMYDDPVASQTSLMERLSRVKFTLAFSNAVSPAAYTHPTREYLTGRWTDALACGAVVAGIAPACAATAELLWRGATLELSDTVDRAQGIQRIADAVSAWTPQTASDNHRRALQRLDWRWRFRELAASLSVESERLDAEIDALQAALRSTRPDTAVTLRAIKRPPLTPRALTVCPILVLALALVLTSSASPRRTANVPTLFVRVSGSDAGRCTRAAPCASLARAYALARPGDDRERRRREVRGADDRVQAGPDAAARDLPTGKRGEGDGERRTEDPGVPPRTATDDARRSRASARGQRRRLPQHPEPRSLDAGTVQHRVFRRRGLLRRLRLPLAPRRRRASGLPAAAQHPLRRRVLPRLAGGLGGPAHRMPADPRRQRDHDPQLRVQELCDGEQRPRSHGDLHVSWLGHGPKTRNILIENNFFYRSGNTYAIQAGDYANLRFRYNSIVGPILVAGGYGDGTPVELVGNVMGFAGCSAARSGPGRWRRFASVHNVLDGGKCSATDINARSGFVNPNTNLHLRPRAAAINRGDAKSYPKRDIDGSRRPKGGRPDAGADEAR